MDDIIQVRKSFLMRIRAFLNPYAEKCSYCMRRSPENCDTCYEAKTAKHLLRELDTIHQAEEAEYYEPNITTERMRRVMKAIEQAGRPLLSSEIDMGLVNNRQSKAYILQRMVELGWLSAEKKNGRGHYYYSIDTSEFFDNTKEGEEKHGV